MTSVEKASERQRAIQRQVDANDNKNDGKKSDKKAMQAGEREYPVPPFPKQHQKKPGNEAALDPAPMYDNPHYKGSEKLQDKVALITGGDSGIGRAVAVFYAREGADVAICCLADEQGDAQTTKAAVEKEGRRCMVITGDVRKRDFCHDAVQKVVQELGKLDILVNNAAFQIHSSFEDLTEEHFDETLKTNLYGYFFMAQAAVAHMKEGSSIINTGSVTGIMGNDSLLDYSMTKGGIHAFTRSLATHLVPKGIRVNCVAPGPVWTPLNPSDKEADKVSGFGQDTPMKRPAQPEEIAPAYVFLASPCCASYITGEVLPVIGGYSGG